MAGAEMAGAAVGVVVEHLANVIKEETALLGGVHHEVAQLEKTLRSIWAFLKDVERMQDCGEGVREWVRQVRDVAFDIENVVDEFLLSLGPQKLHDPYKFAHFPKHLRARHRIGTEIKRIKILLHGIEQRKNMFATTSLISGVTNSSASDNTQRRLIEPLFTEYSEIVGIEKPKHELMEKLLKEDSGLAVISVCGMGGLGKTTLVRKVYENEKVQKRFNCCAWVTVSQNFSPMVIFEKMFNSFADIKRGNSIGMEHQHSPDEIEHIKQLVEDLKSYLKTKRYLVILDDVWTESAWDDLRYVFPQNELNSRIIITTRYHHVALYCSLYQENIHQMETLPEKEAFTLFCKKAFGGTQPPEIEIPSIDFILKICKGLPLAIVTMGGLLMTKTTSEWNKVLTNLSATLEKNKTVDYMNQVLCLSYDDLPHHLKYCFLYFGLYPEDHEVHIFDLIQQLTAEGFVKPMNEQAPEDLAYDYLQELVHRSLVEVVDYDFDGIIWQCKVHDLMHRLISQKRREENFFTLATDDINPNHEVRRLSVYSDDIAPMGRNFSRLRTLLMLGPKDIPVLLSFRMLRVLNLKGGQIQVFPSEIVKLYHLRYLNLSFTNIDMIPKSIGNLCKLQTLHLWKTNVTELPTEILGLHAIRNLVGSAKKVENGVVMPTRLSTLKDLYVLDIIRMDGGTEQAIELGKLSELRQLRMTCVKRLDWNAICDSITKMRHLKRLVIGINEGEKEPFDLDFVSTLSPTLQSISFTGPLNALKSWSLLRLTNLELKGAGLRKDPLHALQHLPMLRDLRLWKETFCGEEMSCGEDGFLKLKILLIQGLDELRFVHIGKGAMPELAGMHIYECCKLEGVPFGVENLKAMKYLTFRNMLREFIEKVQNEEGEEYAKVKHIPIMRHFFKDGGRLDVEYIT